METDCDENRNNDHTIFPMWDPHDVSLSNPNNVEENIVKILDTMLSKKFQM